MTGRSIAQSSHDPVGTTDAHRLRVRLEQERRALEATLGSAHEAHDPIDTSAIAANLRASLEAVEAAITRIDAGTYGRCSECAEAIPAERLVAIPEATRCVSCQESWSR